MKTNFAKPRKRRRNMGFNPNREYITSAIDEFLQRGGSITKVENISDQWSSFMAISSEREADEFLNGGTAA